MPLLVVRHARAGRRSAYDGDDLDRPLSPRGRDQAEDLVPLLAGYRPRRILSSPAGRCFETVRPVAEILGLSIESVGELAEMLDVQGQMNVPVRNLSLGERMKMELIASLLHRPKVLFLDEPTIGLDVISQKKIRAFLKAYNQATRTTILLTSHYMEDIRALCERVMVISQGRLVYDGPLKGIASRAGPSSAGRCSGCWLWSPVRLRGNNAWRATSCRTSSPRRRIGSSSSVSLARMSSQSFSPCLSSITGIRC